MTESVFLGDDAATLASLERLRALGVRLVLDDFGKGYSSFGYLSRAHFSKIKIDQSFVRGAAEGAKDCVAIVHAILALARGLGVETTAEGVETEEQAEVMRAARLHPAAGLPLRPPGRGRGAAQRPTGASPPKRLISPLFTAGASRYKPPREPRPDSPGSPCWGVAKW